MSVYEARAGVLRAMGHPVRLQILDLLRQGEVCVCHIETALGRRQAYVSQQLMVLRDAELVTSRKDGLQVYYRLGPQANRALLDLVCGPVDPGGRQLLDDCRCPSCAPILIADVR